MHAILSLNFGKLEILFLLYEIFEILNKFLRLVNFLFSIFKNKFIQKIPKNG